jgi:hypothetical protein
MGQYRAKKKHIFTLGYQNSREIFNLNRVNHIRLVLNIYPQKTHIREFVAERIKQRLVFAARATPVGAQAGDEEWRMKNRTQSNLNAINNIAVQAVNTMDKRIFNHI